MDTEIEIKLDVDPGQLAAVDGDEAFAVPPVSAEEQRTTYYDTPDRAVEQAGYRLRVRSSKGGFLQTVKPVTDGAGLFDRQEWEYHVGSAEPDLAALGTDDLICLADSGALQSLAPSSRVTVERRSWLTRHGASQVQLDLDRGTVEADGRSCPLAELELELRSGNAADLVDLAASLAERLPLRISVLTKAERGFALADGTLGQVVKTQKVDIGGEMNVAEAFAAIVMGCLKHYRLNEPLVIEAREPGALHQCRVAMRRLRSAFSLFRPVLADPAAEPFRQALCAFSAQLGDARNLDVYLQRDLADDEERAGLMQRREQAYDQAIAAMQSAGVRAMFIRLVGWSALGEWRGGERAQMPIVGFARKRLDRLWRSVDLGDDDLADLSEEQRHELRIRMKKLRYAVEFLRDVFQASGKRRKRFADAIEALQESLGSLNDLVTARSLVAPSGERWLIRPHEIHTQLSSARRALGELLAAGPIWRDGARREEKRPLEAAV